MSFDETRQLYICHMTSMSGYNFLEGPDINSVTYQIEAIVREEYAQLVRSVGGGNNNHSKNSKERERLLNDGTSRIAKSGLSEFLNFAMTLGMEAKGVPHVLLGIEAAMQSFSSIFGGRSRSLSRNKKKMLKQLGLFSATVGGVMIVAGSRKALRKKLIFQRNRLIQRIMVNVTTHRKQVEKTIGARKFEVTKRIRMKRRNAEALRPSLWAVQVNRPTKNWHERMDNLRTKVADRRGRTLDLWSN